MCTFGWKITFSKNMNKSSRWVRTHDLRFKKPKTLGTDLRRYTTEYKQLNKRFKSPSCSVVSLKVCLGVVKYLKGDDLFVCFCLTCYALLSLNRRNNLLIFFKDWTIFYWAFINLIHKCIGPHHIRSEWLQRGVD